MKSVLISIQPKWCELIASGEKTLEVRKTKPKLEVPFKCYMYCTKSPKGWFWLNSPNIRRDGVVVGEFICDGIRTITASEFIILDDALNAINGSCISPREARSYAGWKQGTHIFSFKDIYGWHISNLVIYENPKKLSDFKKCNRTCYYGHLGLAVPKCKDCKECQVDRPPQSWCYVETLE